jgi:hypothetical protein
LLAGLPKGEKKKSPDLETRAKEGEIEAKALRDIMRGRAQTADKAGNVVAALEMAVRRRVDSAEASAAGGGGGGA